MWDGMTYATSAACKPLSLSELVRVMDKLRAEVPPIPVGIRMGHAIYVRCFTHGERSKDKSLAPLRSFGSLPFRMDYSLEPWEWTPVYRAEDESRLMDWLAASLL